MPDTPLLPAQASATVGVDLGLKDFAVLSDGECMKLLNSFGARRGNFELLSAC